MKSSGAFGSAVLLCLLLSGSAPVAEAVLETLAIDVTLSNAPSGQAPLTMLASHALFGAIPSMDRAEVTPLPLTLPPEKDALLCNNETTSPGAVYQNSILMVPRGKCTFQQKAYNAQKIYGAKAVLVYGALESRYSLNTTKAENKTDYKFTEKDIVWPLDKHDYDCDKGEIMVPSNQISLTPLPYNAKQNNAILEGKDNNNNLCRNLAGCESQACLLTGNKSSTDETQMQACCAWDNSIYLYNDPLHEKEQRAITIPAAYLTLNQAQVLLRNMQDQNKVMVTLYARWKPYFNCSSFLIWALGVAVAAVGAYLTASDYHDLRRRLQKRRAAAQRSDSSASDTSPRRSRPHLPPPEEVLELTAAHAVGFIIMASSSLLFLFYFKIYNVVKVFYAVGCSTAVSQVIIYPIIKKVSKKFGMRDFIVWRSGMEDIGDISAREMFAFGLGLLWGLTWLVMAFRVRNADEIVFFWMTQNIFGACMCVLFMKTIRLSNIHVASILLTVAFFYDIFFVFVTPLLFKGKSVMITVATSGGPPKADALWCEKYPDDRDCQGGDPLPMLLTIPRLFDYQGGSSLLGLGDIVLPGLLISFAARFDAAKSLLGVMGGGSGSLASHCPEQRIFCGCRLCAGGYFVPLVIAYAVGLLMANTAVYLMEMGQPALLYLVPCCLGTMSYIGWRRNELHELWHGPRALKAADRALYGEDYQSSMAATATGTDSHAPLPLDENANDVLGGAVPSAAEEHDGDFPLLEDTNRKS